MTGVLLWLVDFCVSYKEKRKHIVTLLSFFHPFFRRFHVISERYSVITLTALSTLASHICLSLNSVVRTWKHWLLTCVLALVSLLDLLLIFLYEHLPPLLVSPYLSHLRWLFVPPLAASTSNSEFLTETQRGIYSRFLLALFPLPFIQAR